MDADNYVLYRDSTIQDPESGEAQSIRFEVAVSKKLDGVEEDIKAPDTFGIGARGHSFSYNKVWHGTEMEQDQQMEKFGILGECCGASDADSILNSGHSTFNLIATTDTGCGAINDFILYKSLEGIEKSITDYDTLWDYVVSEYPAQISREREMGKLYVSSYPTEKFQAYKSPIHFDLAKIYASADELVSIESSQDLD